VLLGAILWALCAAILSAQTAESELSSSASGVPATADAVIEEMAGAAGVIFAGQVMAVRGSAGSNGAGIVEVEFRVDQAVKGPTTGSIYKLREWAGLWNVAAGGARYRVGQRLLVFLYAPDTNGLTSPVRGLNGALPLRGGGSAPGPDDSTAAAAQWLVDLRWVQTQAVRTYPTPGSPVGGGPVYPRPILPQPVHPLSFYPQTMGGVRLEIEVAREVAIEPLPVRQPPVSVPQPAAAPADTQALTQVIALCRQAMRSSDGLR
jgi:hypothetical protein